MLTKAQAQLIIDAHDITLEDEEEVLFLEENNQALLEAYLSLIAIANGPDDTEDE